MKRAIAVASAVAVLLFLPETNRLDLVVVAGIMYLCMGYLVGCLTGTFERMKSERKWLKGLRWVRRNPPALIDLSGKPEWPLIEESDGYLLFEWLPQNKRP